VKGMDEKKKKDARDDAKTVYIYMYILFEKKFNKSNFQFSILFRND